MIKNNNIDFLNYLDEAYNQSIGELCDRLMDSSGTFEHPILLSVLCDRVDMSNFDKTNQPNIKKKAMKKKLYYKRRNIK